MRILASNPLQDGWEALRLAGLWKYHVGLLIFTVMMASRKVMTVPILQAGIDPLFMTFATSAVAVFFAGLTRFLQGTTRQYSLRATAPTFVVLGLATLMGMGGTNMGLQYITPTFDSLISLALYSTSVSFFAWRFGRGEQVNFAQVFGVVAVATCGIALFSWDDLQGTDLHEAVLGIFWSMIGIVGWAAAVVIITNLVRAEVPIVDVILVRFLAPVLILAPYLVFTGRMSAAQFPQLVILGVWGYFLPFLISFRAVKKLSVVTFAISTMMIPVVVYVMSIVFLAAHPLTTLQWLGGGIIFLAVGYRMVNEIEAGKRMTQRMTRQILLSLRED